MRRKLEYMGYIETWLVAEIVKARENTLLIAYTSIVKWEARSSAESKSGEREREMSESEKQEDMTSRLISPPTQFKSEQIRGMKCSCQVELRLRSKTGCSHSFKVRLVILFLCTLHQCSSP